MACVLTLFASHFLGDTETTASFAALPATPTLATSQVAGGIMSTSSRLSRRPFAGLVSIAVAMTPAWSGAQETAPPPAEDRPATGLETVVVTGSAITGGVKKLEASYNIVTANEEEIRRVESQEHRRPAEDLAGHVAGVDRRPDRREHRNRRFSRRRRRAVLHDAADGLAVVRHADAVVLRNHQHLPARRHGALCGNPARRPVGGVRRRPDGRHRQLPAEDRLARADGQPGPDLWR